MYDPVNNIGRIIMRGCTRCLETPALVNRNIDKDILVRKKHFRDENQGGFMNDIDSDEDDGSKKDHAIHSEAVGGHGEDDSDIEEDIDEDFNVIRQALIQLPLDECKTALRRDKELERANAPGRHREADMHKRQLDRQHTT